MAENASTIDFARFLSNHCSGHKDFKYCLRANVTIQINTEMNETHTQSRIFAFKSSIGTVSQGELSGDAVDALAVVASECRRRRQRR